MSVAEQALTVIACPHCGMRYGVSADTLGPSGRLVQCAQCAKSWQASAGPATALAVPDHPADADTMFSEAEEQALDQEFVEAEAEFAAAAEDPPPARGPEEIRRSLTHGPAATPAEHAAAQRKRAHAFSQRQSLLTRKLPIARLRRGARLVGVSALAVLLGGGYLYRYDIVRTVPDLAGFYAGLGLPVNVVGLEFRNVHTLLRRTEGTDLMRVDAGISSVAADTTPVPPVIVTLLRADGLSLYQWSVAPAARELEPGEVVPFTSELTAPPAGAARVRLSFSTSGSEPTPPARIADQH